MPRSKRRFIIISVFLSADRNCTMIGRFPSRRAGSSCIAVMSYGSIQTSSLLFANFTKLARIIEFSVVDVDG